MHIPDKIIVVGGLPRTGKTILRNTLGSHGQIAFTPTAFNFFYWFSKESYANRGGFQENLDYFLKNNWISEKWGIKNEKINIIGKSRKDLFLALLDIYRSKYFPDRTYMGTYIHLSEEYFHTLIDWFGDERLRFIQIIRNPYENYSSYITDRRISKESRKRNRYNSFVNLFCNMWGQSAVMGMNRALKHPNTCRVLYFEDLIANTEENIKSLCDWIGVDLESNRMFQMVDFSKKQNSAFIDHSNYEINESSVREDKIDRIQYLYDHEIESINSIACTDLLNAMDYNKEPVIINFKFFAETIDNKKVLTKLRMIIKTYLSPLPYRSALFVYLNQTIQIRVLLTFIISIINRIKMLFVMKNK